MTILCLFFSENRRASKSFLEDFNKDVFGDVHVNVHIITYLLHDIHDQIDAYNYNDVLMEQEKNDMIDYDEVFKVKRSF